MVVSCAASKGRFDALRSVPEEQHARTGSMQISGKWSVN
jgi:hypothetical protein